MIMYFLLILFLDDDHKIGNIINADWKINTSVFSEYIYSTLTVVLDSNLKAFVWPFSR